MPPAAGSAADAAREQVFAERDVLRSLARQNRLDQLGQRLAAGGWTRLGLPADVLGALDAAVAWAHRRWQPGMPLRRPVNYVEVGR